MQSDDESKRKEYLAKIELEILRATNERWLGSNSYLDATKLELLRTELSHGQAAIRSVILINGGAAVAVLGFLGHLLSDAPESAVIAPLAYAIGNFVTG